LERLMTLRIEGLIETSLERFERKAAVTVVHDQAIDRFRTQSVERSVLRDDGHGLSCSSIRLCERASNSKACATLLPSPGANKSLNPRNPSTPACASENSCWQDPPEYG